MSKQPSTSTMAHQHNGSHLVWVQNDQFEDLPVEQRERLFQDRDQRLSRVMAGLEGNKLSIPEGLSDEEQDLFIRKLVSANHEKIRQATIITVEHIAQAIIATPLATMRLYLYDFSNSSYQDLTSLDTASIQAINNDLKTNSKNSKMLLVASDEAHLKDLADFVCSDRMPSMLLSWDGIEFQSYHEAQYQADFVMEADLARFFDEEIVDQSIQPFITQEEYLELIKKFGEDGLRDLRNRHTIEELKAMV